MSNPRHLLYFARNERPVTVVIVDDHPVVRDGLQAILSTEPGLSVAGEAGPGRRPCAASPRSSPIFVLMDLVLPDMSGSDVIRHFTNAGAHSSFIVLTSVAGDEEIYRALDAGARGYLFKDMARKELVQAIHVVYGGDRYIPAQVGARLAENFPGTAFRAARSRFSSTWRPDCATRRSPTNSKSRKPPSTLT